MDEPCAAEAAAAKPGCPSLDDAQLAAWIEGIVDHDERALLALYEATLSRVYGLVLRLVRRSQLAEEVAEEVFFQVWRQAPRFDPERGRPLTWLLGMARSRAIDAIRREARFQHEELDEESVPLSAPAAESGDELLAVAQGHAELHRALLLLKPQPRQLVALAFFNGLSHEEIASQTSLPLGTVKSQIRRALITLREALGDTGAHALPA
ncbi:RNA polymerase subunit sigma-24 [Pelomonas sp. Root1217]|nr:RNA polymerase subunit sigma-24 [Pelomonas sp. Root1217]